MVKACVLQRVAALHHKAFGVSYDEFLSRLRDGLHDGLVEGFVRAEALSDAANADALVALQSAAPAYSFCLESSQARISGPYCRRLSSALARIGGYWDGAGGLNRKCFIVPSASWPAVLQAFKAAEKAREVDAQLLGDSVNVLKARGQRFLRSA
jgi:hypothetical protein